VSIQADDLDPSGAQHLLKGVRSDPWPILDLSRRLGRIILAGIDKHRHLW
jgi:hypothetical protein